jgi:hypothetical protein
MAIEDPNVPDGSVKAFVGWKNSGMAAAAGDSYRGGAVAVRGARGGAVAVRGGRYGYGGYGYRRPYGAAGVGAAAAGAYYYRGGFGYDAYGNWICPGYY